MSVLLDDEGGTSLLTIDASDNVADHANEGNRDPNCIWRRLGAKLTVLVDFSPAPPIPIATRQRKTVNFLLIRDAFPSRLFAIITQRESFMPLKPNLLKPNLADPVRAQSLVDAIVERLEAAIVSGELSADAKISEQGLARQMGVSRGPLREAMRRLEGRKLIERTPNKGARVVALSSEDLESLLVVREALEGMACRLAADRMTAPELEGLQKLLEQHGKLEDVRKGTGYYQESRDFDFHFQIIKASGNERLVEILCGDLYHLLRVYRYKASRMHGRAAKAFREHKRIVKALAARDPNAAEAAMRDHLRNARAYAGTKSEANSDAKSNDKPNGKSKAK